MLTPVTVSFDGAIDWDPFGLQEVRPGVYLGPWALNLRIDQETVDLPPLRPGEVGGRVARFATAVAEAELLRLQHGALSSLGRCVGSSGVVDSAEQLLGLYDFEGDPRQLAVLLYRLQPDRATPPGEGWRRSAFGEYHGAQDLRPEAPGPIEPLLYYLVVEVLPRYGLPPEGALAVRFSVAPPGGGEPDVAEGTFAELQALLRPRPWLRRAMLYALACGGEYRVPLFLAGREPFAVPAPRLRRGEPERYGLLRAR
jgi:hypothetical protein